MLKTHQWKTTWFLKNGPKALTDTSSKRYRDGKQSYEKIWTILWKALYRMSSRKCKFKKTVRYDHRAMLLLLLSLFSRVWLYDHKDGSPPGSSVLGILQARTLKWVAMPSSRGIFPTPGIESASLCLLHWQAGSLLLLLPEKPLLVKENVQGLIKYSTLSKMTPIIDITWPKDNWHYWKSQVILKYFLSFWFITSHKFHMYNILFLILYTGLHAHHQKFSFHLSPSSWPPLLISASPTSPSLC